MKRIKIFMQLLFFQFLVIKTVDPDPHCKKMLDPDPQSALKPKGSETMIFFPQKLVFCSTENFLSLWSLKTRA
jgi:hypothetical protein